MSENYNKAAERLLEKLLFHKDKLNFDCINLKKPFPVDQLTKEYPQIMDWVQEVQDEFRYEMSEFQCSWAVCFVKTNASLEEYNKKNNLSLQPRA